MWSEKFDQSLAQPLKNILLQDRRGRCFFVEFQEGMSFEGARELHKLRNDNAQLKRSYRFTQWGLGIAAASLLLNLVYNFFKDFIIN